MAAQMLKHSSQNDPVSLWSACGTQRRCRPGLPGAPETCVVEQTYVGLFTIALIGRVLTPDQRDRAHRHAVEGGG
jgi:hypothetical protein